MDANSLDPPPAGSAARVLATKANRSRSTVAPATRRATPRIGRLRSGRRTPGLLSDPADCCGRLGQRGQSDQLGGDEELPQPPGVAGPGRLDPSGDLGPQLGEL